ncbi:hypothetical protein [Acetobacter syzygii]|nr:hypothetical protein [Acetobacter syzygii]NSL92981.1 hypothetical protein [Acetobacter syzygii]
MSEDVIGTDPWTVLSPRANWKLTAVLYVSKWWSMAYGTWTDENGSRAVLAQRWNGEEGEKGNPISSGHATWFVLPDETYPLYIESRFIPDAERETVRQALGLICDKKEVNAEPSNPKKIAATPET